MSRALVSICSIGLVVVALLANSPKQLFSNYLKNGFCLACLAFFLSYAISGFWSDNMDVWSKDTVMKLSFIALPLGFAGFNFSDNKAFKQIVIGINIILVGVIANSLFHYYADVEAAEEQYMLVTTKYSDHIRFSLFLVFTFICNLYLLFERQLTANERTIKWFLWFSSVLFFIYIHYLSARTGLVCIYAAVLTFSVVKLWSYKKWVAMLAALMILGMPIIAFFASPRFQQKIEYMQHEADQWGKASDEVQYTLSDNNRFLSYDVALISIKEHPLLGVGSGDLKPEMIRLYGQEYPTIPPKGALSVPHIQFLSSFMAVGIPLGLITLLALLITPLLRSKGKVLYMLLLSMLLFLAFMIDAMLEVQFGILVLLFYALLMQKFMKSDAKCENISK